MKQVSRKFHGSKNQKSFFNFGPSSLLLFCTSRNLFSAEINAAEIWLMPITGKLQSVGGKQEFNESVFGIL